MLITRYLLKNILSAFLFVALTLTVVIWLTQSLKILEMIANSDAPAGLFFKLVSLSLPKFLEIIFPLSLVISVIFVYNKMIMENEMVVMRSCGFDQYALAKPALALAGILTVILLVMTTWLSPRSYTEMQILRQNVRAEYSSFLLREGVFNTFGKDMTVYLRARDNDGSLLGLMIHDGRDRKKPPVTVTAKKGRIDIHNGIPALIVYDGIRQQMDPASNTLSKLSFMQYMIEVTGFEEGAETRWRNAKERTLWELLHPDMTDKTDRKNAAAFYAEAHHRIVSPFNALGFILIALSSILLSPFSRRGQTKKISLAICLIIGLEAANLALMGATKKHIEAIPLLYIATFVPIIGGFYALSLKGEQALMSLMRRWKSGGRSPQAGAA